MGLWILALCAESIHGLILHVYDHWRSYTRHLQAEEKPSIAFRNGEYMISNCLWLVYQLRTKTARWKQQTWAALIFPVQPHHEVHLEM